MPWAVENIALLTNKALAPTCPATLDDAVSTAKTLIAAGTATSVLGIAMQIGERGDADHWNPLYTSDGGYTFKHGADGSYDASDLGVGKEGSIAAGVRLQHLVNDGILKASLSFDIAKESLSEGTSPYFITGPWQIPDPKAALGDNLMVCPVPNWAGSSFHAQPFVGVRTFMQPAKAKNAVLASTFLNDEVMTTEFMDGMFAVDPRSPHGSSPMTRQHRICTSRPSGSTPSWANRSPRSSRWPSCSPISVLPSIRSRPVRTRPRR